MTQKTCEELLHAAICQAVSIMNQSMDIARSAEGRQARDILRAALIDYADAVMEQPTTEAEQIHMRNLHRSRP